MFRAIWANYREFGHYSSVLDVHTGAFRHVFGHFQNVLGIMRNAREFEIGITGNSKGMFGQTLPSSSPPNDAYPRAFFINACFSESVISVS